MCNSNCYAQDPAGGANSAAPVLAGFGGEERKGKGERERKRRGEETENEKEVKGESRGGKEKGGKWEGREKKVRNLVHLSFFLKTFFCKSFPLQPFFFFFQNELHDSPDLITVTSNISAFTFQFFCFTIFSCRLRAVD